MLQSTPYQLRVTLAHRFVPMQPLITYQLCNGGASGWAGGGEVTRGECRLNVRDATWNCMHE